jgi:UDP-N-acetylglucosamine acyltransferase
MASGNPSAPHGLNAEGLKRRGFEPDTVALLRRAYRTLYRSELTLAQAREALEAQLAALDAATSAPAATLPASALGQAEALRLLTRFLARVERGIVR